MTDKIIDIINDNFNTIDKEVVINQLLTIQLEHVWNGDINLLNTRHSILKLANGNIDEVIYFTKCAKVDFRDVIMWAGEKEEKENK